MSSAERPRSPDQVPTPELTTPEWLQNNIGDYRMVSEKLSEIVTDTVEAPGSLFAPQIVTKHVNPGTPHEYIFMGWKQLDRKISDSMRSFLELVREDALTPKGLRNASDTSPIEVHVPGGAVIMPYYSAGVLFAPSRDPRIIYDRVEGQNDSGYRETITPEDLDLLHLPRQLKEKAPPPDHDAVIKGRLVHVVVEKTKPVGTYTPVKREPQKPVIVMNEPVHIVPKRHRREQISLFAAAVVPDVRQHELKGYTKPFVADVHGTIEVPEITSSTETNNRPKIASLFESAEPSVSFDEALVEVLPVVHTNIDLVG